jgi:hypothetical protein
MENGGGNRREKFDGRIGHDGRHFHDGQMHLTMREQRDGALMFRRTGVLVKQFVQLGRSRHRVQKQDKPGQQRGDDRLAVPLELTPHELHCFVFSKARAECKQY